MDPNGTIKQRSIALMRDTFVPNATFIPLGALTIIFNIMIILIILLSKTLRTKCFILLAANAWSDFLLGAGYMGTGSVRVYRHLVGHGEVIGMFQCFQEVCAIAFAQILSLSMAFVLVIDRFLATFFAQRYKQWSLKRLTLPLLIFAYTFALAQLAVHFQNSWSGSGIILKSCGIEETVSPSNLSALTTLQMAVSGVIVLLNIAIACGIWLQKKKFQIYPVNSNNSVSQSGVDSKIVRAITVIVILHMVTHLGGRIVIFLMAMYSDDLGKALTNRYGREVVVLNAACHFFVLYWLSSPFRAAAKRWFDVCFCQQ